MCDIFITLILYNYYVLLPFVNIDYYSVNGSLEINNLGVLKDNRCKIRFLIINNNNASIYSYETTNIVPGRRKLLSSVLWFYSSNGQTEATFAYF